MSELPRRKPQPFIGIQNSIVVIVQVNIVNNSVLIRVRHNDDGARTGTALLTQFVSDREFKTTFSCVEAGCAKPNRSQSCVEYFFGLRDRGRFQNDLGLRL